MKYVVFPIFHQVAVHYGHAHSTPVTVESLQACKATQWVTVSNVIEGLALHRQPV